MVSTARELFAYRSLVRNLVAKDLKVRYKHSLLGFLWARLNPLLMMAIYTIVFTRLLPTGIPKFQVFVFAGLLPWNWCARSLSQCATCLLDNATIITKVYFPRVLLPVAAIAAEGVHFLLALPALFLLMLAFDLPFTAWALYLPLLMLIQAVLLAGLGLFLAALNVRYRDTGVILEVIITGWFFLTPVFYDIKRTDIGRANPDTAAWVYRLNPMASLITEYRTILYDGAAPDLLFEVRAGLTALAIFALGYAFFAASNRRLGEHI